MLELLLGAVIGINGFYSPDYGRGSYVNISHNGIRKIKQWEGWKNEPYDDGFGHLTIGVGHLLTPRELETGTINILGETVDWKNGLTDKQVADLLDQDLDRFEKHVSSKVNVPLKQNQFDALVSFAMNVGNGAFSRSTLLKKLNEGRYESIPDELRKWNKKNGRVVKGLVNRRAKEIRLWGDSPLYLSSIVQYGEGGPRALTVQTALNKLSRGEELKVDGLLGKKSSARMKEVFGFYLAGDPRNNV